MLSAGIQTLDASSHFRWLVGPLVGLLVGWSVGWFVGNDLVKIGEKYIFTDSK